MEPRLFGKYELRELIATGGQGEVWKAFDSQLRRYVAIKQLHANMQSDPEFTSRFEREGQFVASLHHPNIVQIYDFQIVYDPDSETRTAYMVMDYIKGPTLAYYIRNTSRKGQYPAAADIVYIFTAISLAIDYAHEKGMIHRDIKPANIILDQRSPRRNSLGVPILTDFGISKLHGGFTDKTKVLSTPLELQGDDDDITLGGDVADETKVLGTPLYVSPEQAQGLVGDKRSDLYSLGIILYEMTTGVTPFRGTSLMIILMQHLQEPPLPPALINPHITPALSEVILKSIAKDPDARFPSASAMTIAIAESFNIPVPAELSTTTQLSREGVYCGEGERDESPTVT
jgi:eukaryotic-like serine/threonine-protein kinase